MAASAVRANSGDQKAMALGAEAVGHADFLPELENLVIPEFNHLIALGAVQMIVRRITVIVLERIAVGEPKFSKKPRLDEQPQGAIDRGPTDRMPRLEQVSNQFVRIEMLVAVEDMTNHISSRASQFVSPNFEKFSELLDGVLQDGWRNDQVVLRFGHGEIPEAIKRKDGPRRSAKL